METRKSKKTHTPTRKRETTRRRSIYKGHPVAEGCVGRWGGHNMCLACAPSVCSARRGDDRGERRDGVGIRFTLINNKIRDRAG